MLNSFREKLQNVQQDISTGFRQLLTIDELSGLIPPIITGNQAHEFESSARSSRSNSVLNDDGSEAINLHAGVPILTHFEKKWQQLHAQNEQNLKLIEEANEYANEVADYCQRRQNVLDSLVHVFEQVDNLHEATDEIESDLKRLSDQINSTEHVLLQLEQNNYERRLSRLQQEQELMFGQQTERLQREFEQFREILENEHQDKARDHERRVLMRNQVQREQFRAEFEADLAEYKRTGKLRARTNSHRSSVQVQQTKVPSKKSSEPFKAAKPTDAATHGKPSLEQIEVQPNESDQQALIEFLS